MADPTKPRWPATKMRLLLSMSAPTNHNAMARIGECPLLPGKLHIVFHHHPHKLSEGCLRSPPKLPASFVGIAHQMINFGRPQIAWVELDMALPVDAGEICRQVQEFS